MTTPYHMQEVDDEKGVLPEGVDVEGATDNITRVEVDVEPPGGTSELLESSRRTCWLDS
jgi:hypothetical protein